MKYKKYRVRNQIMCLNLFYYWAYNIFQIHPKDAKASIGTSLQILLLAQTKENKEKWIKWVEARSTQFLIDLEGMTRVVTGLDAGVPRRQRVVWSQSSGGPRPSELKRRGGGSKLPPMYGQPTPYINKLTHPSLFLANLLHLPSSPASSSASFFLLEKKNQTNQQIKKALLYHLNNPSLMELEFSLLVSVIIRSFEVARE